MCGCVERIKPHTCIHIYHVSSTISLVSNEHGINYKQYLPLFVNFGSHIDDAKLTYIMKVYFVLDISSIVVWYTFD